MHIAVVIPAFNVAPYIRDALASVVAQSYPHWSMVVVDDGSTDRTAEVAGAFMSERCTLIRQPNAGVSAARNRGIASVSGDAFLFLDADDWLAPDALARLAAVLRAAPYAVAASGGHSRVSPDGRIRRTGPPPAGDILDQLIIRNLFANGGHLLIRDRAIAAAGSFRTDLSYGEDWEYWVRLATAGRFASVKTPDPVLFVRERPGSAYLHMATDPGRFGPCLDAIYDNPAIVRRVGAARVRVLRQRALAENAWVIGRELIRHRQKAAGMRWLGRSLRKAPTVKRIALSAAALLGQGPFRPYATARRDQPLRSSPESSIGIHEQIPTLTAGCAARLHTYHDCD